MAIKDYNGSDATSKLLATTSANGFMSSTDKKIVNHTTNPNLLYNPNFKIWQRGIGATTTTTGSIVCYTADRWYIWEKATATRVSNGIKVSVNCGVSQLEEWAFDTNKYYTISWSIDGTIYSRSFKGTLVESGVISCYNNYSNNNTVVHAIISVIMKANQTLNWVKLEEGETRTPFIDPDPALELARCKWFYNYLNTEVSTTFAWSNAAFIGRVSNPYIMRTAPTLQSAVIGGFKDGNGVSTTDITTLTNTMDEIIFRYNYANGFTDKYLQRWGNFELDAELYS